jgi:hypothetical protein
MGTLARENPRVRDTRSVLGFSPTAGRALSIGEIKSLLEACTKGTPAGARDSVVLAFDYEALVFANWSHHLCRELSS